jgi:hypothetical protein
MIKLRKQFKFLEKGKVSPIHIDYPYGNVGLMLFVGKMGSGKTKDVLKHLMISDNLGENNKGFNSKIVYSGSVDEDDETYTTFKKALKIPIVNIPPDKLMQFLKEHIRVKKKYYDIYKYVIYNNKEPNKIMQNILNKHRFDFFGSRRFDINKRNNINNKRFDLDNNV